MTSFISMPSRLFLIMSSKLTLKVNSCYLIRISITVSGVIVIGAFIRLE